VQTGMVGRDGVVGAAQLTARCPSTASSSRCRAALPSLIVTLCARRCFPATTFASCLQLTSSF
jgi:hypothetical protein